MGSDHTCRARARLDHLSAAGAAAGGGRPRPATVRPVASLKSGLFSLVLATATTSFSVENSSLL